MIPDGGGGFIFPGRGSFRVVASGGRRRCYKAINVRLMIREFINRELLPSLKFTTICTLSLDSLESNYGASAESKKIMRFP